MKKILFILLLFALKSQAQFPVTQTLGSSKTLVTANGGLGADSGFVFRKNFADTAAANKGFLDGIPNILIVVNDSFWKRNNAATKWIKQTQNISATTPISFSNGVISLGTVPISKGGTGLTAVGSAGQLLRVNSGATGLEYFTHNFLTSDSTLYFDLPLEKYTAGGLTRVKIRNEQAFFNAGWWQGIPIRAELLKIDGYVATFNAGNGGEMVLAPAAEGLTEESANGLYLQIANNLSDLASASTARTNLGLTGTLTNGFGISSLSFNGTANATAKLDTSSGGAATYARGLDWYNILNGSKQATLTNSAGLAAALNDETGIGLAVFATSPTLVTPNLGTPSAVTLTNGTGLPISTGVSGLGSGVATFLGTPSSANLRTALTDETGIGAAVFADQPTMRWKQRVGSTTSSATPTINTDNTDIYKITALAVDITSMTTNLSGTPNDGDALEIQITGTATRAITWGASFVSGATSLPTSTSGTTTLTVFLKYYSTSSYGNSKWVCVSTY